MSNLVYWGTLLLVVCTACTEEEAPTRVEVEVDSDLGAELSSLEVAIRDSADRRTGEKHTFQIKAQRLPFSFAVAREGKETSFVVVATGWSAAHEFLAQAKARASFTSGRVIKVGIYLSSLCTKRCGDGMSCNTGATAGAESCTKISTAQLGEPTRPMTPVAGSGGDPGPPALGGNCTGADELACAGSGRLICRGGKWLDNGNCEADTRCDGGECREIPAECRGKEPDSHSCDGTTRIHCAPDLLHFTSEACPEHASCDPAAPAQCRCDAEYEKASDGTCTSVNHCPAGACAGGECVSASDSFSCQCGAGYSGTGTQGCLAISCAAKGVCGPYECRDRAPSYECIGQFAGWPMPDRLAAATADVSMPGGVIDKATQLMWQRELQDCSDQNADTCVWDEATKYCDELRLAGHDDWRLPTPIELLSIMDTEISNPALDSMLFPETPGAGFWTGSRAHDNPNTDAWYVNAYHASVDTTPMVRQNRARCVRLVR